MSHPESSPASHLGFTPIKPSPDAPRILVVGAGIIGMSIAWTLLDAGFNVTVLAERKVSLEGDRLTSQIAGALWEYPPAVCGHYNTHDSHTVETYKRWAMVSYHAFHAMAQDKYLAEKFGVGMHRTVFFFDKPQDKEQLKKMYDIESSGIIGFKHDPEIVNEYALVDRSQWQDAYQMLSPMIDTDQALFQITELVRKKGAVFEIGKRLEGDLASQEAELLLKYRAEVIVNASGLGSHQLANDKNVYPLHGAVMRLHNDGVKFPRIQDALVVSAPSTGPTEASEFVFIVPRNDHILYVGGFSAPLKPNSKDDASNWLDPNAWRIDQNDSRVQVIKNSASQFLQSDALDFTRLDVSYPIAQGLRPARIGGARLERERRIVHCYGHAGSGWSLSFGCALDVKTLVRHIVDEGALGLPGYMAKTSI